MISFPFTSKKTFDTFGQPVFDRAVNSKILRDLIKQYFTDGVFPNPSTNFQVVEDTGMNVLVHSGGGVLNGATFFEENDRVIKLEAASSLDRIDLVIVRINETEEVRSVDLYIVKGTPATTPVAPFLTRTTSIKEIAVAEVFVPANTSQITQSRITDTRLNIEKCGYVTPIQTIDTTTLYNQIQSDLADFRLKEQQDFIIWFDVIKDQLSEDAAGNLQLQIVDIMENIDTDLGIINDKIAKLGTQYTLSVPTTGWTAETGGYYATQTLAGATTSDIPHVSLRSATNYPTDAEIADAALIVSVITGTDEVTFHATDIPSATVNLEVRL